MHHLRLTLAINCANAALIALLLHHTPAVAHAKPAKRVDLGTYRVIWREARDVSIAAPRAHHEGLTLIMRAESFRGDAYWDKTGKKWTIGYGETIGVKPGDHMTIAQARARVATHYMTVRAEVRKLAPMADHYQTEALTAMAYNVGVNALAHSTLLAKLNAGDRMAAAQQFSAWIWSGGKQLDGLRVRRQHEARLFLAGL